MCLQLHTTSLLFLMVYRSAYKDVSLERFYCPELAYANSKAAIIIFSQYLQQKFLSSGSNIKVVCLHPGIVFTELALQDHARITVEIAKLWFKTADQGGDTLVHAALSPELDKLDLAGVYLENSQPVDIGSYAKDPQLQKHLWDTTKTSLELENICGYE
jgi:NAD(P)-dependent dehydrogenase (short-subunit alcohol dehydrogenase family)